MGLIANGYRLGFSPFRHVGGAPTTIANGSTAPRNMGQLTGRMRNIAWLTQPNTALPQGGLAPGAWMLPQKPGAIASRGLTSITLTATGSVSRALAVAGTASIEVTAAGQVGAIGTVVGAASLSLTASGTVFGRAAVAGNASITLTASGNVGALVFLSGSASISLTAFSTMGCTATVAGTAFLSGAAEGGTLTAAGIADAVMGSIVEGTLTLRQSHRLLLAPVAGDATGLDGPVTAFKSQDGSKNRIVGTISGGNRTITSRDSS